MALALLGPFQASLDGQLIQDLNSNRLRALLAYLATEIGREHSREQVASLLWPERPDGEALSALRYALSNLHAALRDRDIPSPFLRVTRTTVQFNPASDHWLDVDEFQALRGRADVAALERAVSLYRGPFLDGLSVDHSPSFEEWMLLRGEAYREGLLSVLGTLTSLQIARGEHQEAAGWARRQLELEPYREQAHRQLMAALALGGERAAAVAHYQACRRLLAEELGCEPDDDTQALYAQIRDGGLSQPWPQPQPSPAPRRITASARAVRAADSEPPTRFVAREQELVRLGRLLERALAGHGGVALIMGEAGEGKTALVDAFARQACQAHGDLIALRGNCNAHGGEGDPYLPFREILQTLAGDVEGQRAGGTLPVEQARRVWEALPTMGAALVEHGTDLIDTLVPGEALLRRVEGFTSPHVGRPPGAARPLLGHASGQVWQARLRDIVRRGQEGAAPAPQADLFAQVTQVLHIVSASRPLLLAIDDLQWADSGTAALLFHLGRRLAGSRILLVCAYRPAALHDPLDPNGSGKPLGSVLQELIRQWGDIVVDLDRSDDRAFVEAYVDREPNCLRAAFRQALYDQTGGNPLFTVELLRTFQERGDLTRDEEGRWVEGSGLRWEGLPPRVEAVIAERLGRLPREARRLLEAASVEGESFSAEVAARALGAEPAWVLQWLSGPLSAGSQLVQAIGRQFLSPGGQPVSRYRFAHALFQEYLYGRLDAVNRAHLHGEVGAALEGLCGGDEVALAQASPQLARHYEEAGRVLEAARYRLEAGRWAAKLVAYDEAIAHLERGLALLEGVPASRERLRLELRLCTAMSTPAMLQRGWQAPTYTRVLERLSDLTQHPDLQDDPRHLTALSVLALSAGWSADPERSGRVGQQLLDLAHSAGSGQAQEGDQQSLMLGHWALGLSHWLRGQLVPAREHLGRAVALYDPDANRPWGRVVAIDPGVMAHAMLGAVLWQLGYPDQARDGFRQAVAQGQALDQPSSLAFAHFMAMMITAALGRDVAAAQSHCQALRPLGQLSLVYGVWAELLAALEQTRAGGAGSAASCLSQGVARAMEALSTWQTAGSGAGYAGLLRLQAEVCAQAGQPEMGLAAMDRAMAWFERTGLRAMEAEIWRMRGELLLLAERPGSSEANAQHSQPVRSRVDEAEACFHHALAVAQEQGSRWWELRAAASLVRLRQQQGEAFAAELAEAQEHLRGVYEQFTEGFTFPDLVEAKALLDALPDPSEQREGVPGTSDFADADPNPASMP